MNLYYKPKHMKQPIIYKIRTVLNFVIEETIWYGKWWGNLFITIFHKLYNFGEWIIEKSIWLIDAHDDFWDRVEEKIKEL